MNTESTSGKPATPDLANYRVSGYSPGAGIVKRSVWYCVNVIVFMSPLVPFYGFKRVLLSIFGARIGSGVVIKPRVNIKHPWRLSVGDFSWVGEGAWIDNLADVTIGADACISQGAYLMTGNHDYTKTGFNLITGSVLIEDGAWVGAGAIVCPGVTMARNSVLSAGSVLTSDTNENGIYAGNPAKFKRERRISE